MAPEMLLQHNIPIYTANTHQTRQSHIDELHALTAINSVLQELVEDVAVVTSFCHLDLY